MNDPVDNNLSMSRQDAKMNTDPRLLKPSYAPLRDGPDPRLVDAHAALKNLQGDILRAFDEIRSLAAHIKAASLGEKSANVADLSTSIIAQAAAISDHVAAVVHVTTADPAHLAAVRAPGSPAGPLPGQTYPVRDDLGGTADLKHPVHAPSSTEERQAEARKPANIGPTPSPAEIEDKRKAGEADEKRAQADRDAASAAVKAKDKEADDRDAAKSRADPYVPPKPMPAAHDPSDHTG